jgi:ribosomal protein S18 acetylase RimI-like enzyme
MKLTQDQKTNEMFVKLWALNDMIFAEDERAPQEKLRVHFYEDDIFVLQGATPEEIAGFAFVTERGGPYLMIMAIAPAYQKCGNGRLLLAEIIAQYPGYDIQLTCKVDNVPAQVLYLRSGFRPARVIPRYYGATDGLLMRRIS